MQKGDCLRGHGFCKDVYTCVLRNFEKNIFKTVWLLLYLECFLIKAYESALFCIYSEVSFLQQKGSKFQEDDPKLFLSAFEKSRVPLNLILFINVKHLLSVMTLFYFFYM